MADSNSSSGFKLEVRERERIVERSETRHSTINGYDVFFVRDERGFVTVSMAPESWRDNFRLGIINCHPKRVSDLEQFADVAGNLFRTVAAALREAGEDDLRSSSDRIHDEMEEERERYFKKLMGKRSKP